MKRSLKILALMLSEAPWQYYIKYETFLFQLNHPFRNHIDFLRDTRMAFPEHIFSQYNVIAFYYHDPLGPLYPKQYAYAKQLEWYCKLHGIHLLHAPDGLSNTTKTTQLNSLKQAGHRVATAIPFSTEKDLAPFFETNCPFFIRFNDGHDSQGEYVQGPFYSQTAFTTQFKPSAFIETKHMKNTCAIEWIDTRCSDGLYRKYRAYATPVGAIKGFVTQSDHWYIHGNNAHQSKEAHANQAEYISTAFSQNEIDLFTNVCKTLALDFCAIDYAFTPRGELIIWEANPHPALSNKEPSRTRITHFLSDYYSRFLMP